LRHNQTNKTIMKGLLINPTDKTITEVEIAQGLQPIYDALGNNCTTFAVPIVYPNGDGMYVDDEGLFKQQNGGFQFPNWSYPLLGNALILGSDEEGNSVDVKTTKEELLKDIEWLF